MAHDFKKIEDDIREKELRHDEEVIDEKRSDIEAHRTEDDKDKSKFLKDIHEAEIRHDEKVIERKEKDAARHEAEIKKTEQELNDVK